MGRCVWVWCRCGVTRIQEVQSVYSYVQEFTIVEVCRSQEEFGDEADSCSEVTLGHTGVFIVDYSALQRQDKIIRAITTNVVSTHVETIRNTIRGTRGIQ